MGGATLRSKESPHDVSIRSLLHARRNSIPDDDPTFEIVDRFLAALETVPPRR